MYSQRDRYRHGGPLKIYYADEFVLPLPPGHRFPMQKYAALRARVTSELSARHELLVPEAATDAELERAHDPEYVRRVVSGTLDRAEIRRIGFPWSPQMVERSRRSVGATIAAARAALVDRVAVNLAGGTHHASADQGEGFCVFNDVAVAARAMQAEGRAHRIAVIDTDVHQGNGTAAIFRDDPSVFTFSVHGDGNFPFRKTAGDLDIGLPDGADDALFLDAVRRGTEASLAETPEVVVFLAGADPWHGDRLGRLGVTRAGLLERDRIVLDACTRQRVPVVVVMAGGYAPEVDDIVAIHFATVALAARYAECALSTTR